MLKAEQTGLLLVDIQGKLAQMVSDSQAMISNTVKLIRCCQALSIPMVVLEQNPKGLGPTAPEIQPYIGDADKFVKYTFNALDTPEIEQHILDVNKTSWLVAGIEAHICVYQTVSGLLNRSLHVEVMSDCISSRLRFNVDLAIDNMRHMGANITSLEMSVYQMLQTSKSAVFRDALNIIK